MTQISIIVHLINLAVLHAALCMFIPCHNSGELGILMEHCVCLVIFYRRLKHSNFVCHVYKLTCQKLMLNIVSCLHIGRRYCNIKQFLLVSSEWNPCTSQMDYK